LSPPMASSATFMEMGLLYGKKDFEQYEERTHAR